MKSDDQYKKILSEGCQQLNLEITEAQVQALLTHLLEMQRWNKTHNLTSIKNLRDMIVRHTLDALSIVSCFKEVTHILDLGTGPGVPGIPLAIVLPNKTFTLLDSNHKKTSFVRAIAAQLALKNCEVVTGRIEALEASDRYDAVVSRAVAEPKQLMALSSDVIKSGGLLVCMLGQPVDKSSFNDRNFECDHIQELKVPYLEAKRQVALVKRR